MIEAEVKERTGHVRPISCSQSFRRAVLAAALAVSLKGCPRQRPRGSADPFCRVCCAKVRGVRCNAWDGRTTHWGCRCEALEAEEVRHWRRERRAAHLAWWVSFDKTPRSGTGRIHRRAQRRRARVAPAMQDPSLSQQHLARVMAVTQCSHEAEASLSIYLYVFLSIYMYTYLPIDLPVYTSIHLSTYTPVDLILSVCMSGQVGLSI